MRTLTVVPVFLAGLGPGATGLTAACAFFVLDSPKPSNAPIINNGSIFNPRFPCLEFGWDLQILHLDILLTHAIDFYGGETKVQL